MKWLVVVLIVGLLAWQGYAKHDERPAQDLSSSDSVDTTTAARELHHAEVEDSIESALPGSPEPSRFTCDGRTHCSQMDSCAEAMFFLEKCPGVEMDGDNDGVPCERQWCEP